MQALSIIVCAIACFSAGYTRARISTKELEREAVKRGHAAWVVQPDGSTVFVWAGEVQK